MVKLTEQQVLAKSRASDLESVRSLNCWGCELTDVSLLDEVENIEVINASANEIETLKHFKKCVKLKELYLRNNCIKDFAEFFHLQSLEDLRFLWVSDNPICEEDPDYRMTILKILPQLTTLDNIIVSEEEILESQEKGKDIKLPKTEDCQDQVKNINLNEKENSISISDKDCSPKKEENILEENKNTHIESPTNLGPTENTPKEALTPETSEKQLHPRNFKIQSAVQMSLDETNNLRKELGFKPVSAEKYSSVVNNQSPQQMYHQHHHHHTTNPFRKQPQTNNILMASLSLIEELDEDSLQTLRNAIDEKLKMSESAVPVEEKPAVSVRSRVKNIIDTNY